MRAQPRLTTRAPGGRVLPRRAQYTAQIVTVCMESDKARVAALAARYGITQAQVMRDLMGYLDRLEADYADATRPPISAPQVPTSPSPELA